MSRASSTYVSPNLAPTSEWGQQTSTGVFRPPPALQLQPSSTANYSSPSGDRRFDSRHACLLPPTTAQKARDSGMDGGLEASASFPCSGGVGVASPSTTPLVGPSAAISNGSSPLLLQLPSSPHDSLPLIMKMIRFAIHAEEDDFFSQKEVNRLLEAELQREQEQRRVTNNQLAALTKATAALSELARQQKAAIEELKPLGDSSS